MKKIIRFMLLLVISTKIIYAHGEGVHQHMVREAYKLLKQYVGQDIREMKDHVGYNEEGNGQFNPGGKIVIGAYQEDHSDATNEGYGLFGWFITMTHFWEPDLVDNSTFTWGTHSYTNAYQKARKYLYGCYELRVPAERIIEAYNAPSNLIQFYKDGKIYYKGYYDKATLQFVSRNRWVTASLEFRDQVVWEILGRVCHLLGDMTVPAHVHNDPHEPNQLDSYEEWMNQPSVYNQWTYQNAINQGGLINVVYNTNPLKYLFYTTSQITDFFRSDDYYGNNGFGSNDPFTNYSGLQQKITDLYMRYGSVPLPLTPEGFSVTSNNCFVYGIRAMAGFLYWFAKEADLLPIPLTYAYVSGTYELYQGGTGNWYVQLGNGIAPFTYNWEIMYLDGAGFLQNYESVKEKKKKDKEKKKDGDITIESVPSNYWFSVGTNSSTFSKPHNPSDLRDYKLRCTVTDGSNTTKTSNEWYVDVVADPPPLGNIIADNKSNDVISLPKDSEEISIPTDYALNQNYPNPFNPTTRISYSLPDANFVTLKIYDMLGSEVATLVNENKPAGKHEVEFDASKLSSGTYVYKLIAGNYQITKKMQLVK